MNKIILMGRLTREPDVQRKSTGDRDTTIARFAMAVDRRGGQEKADFFNCVAFDKQAEFVEKYLKKGTKILITGRVQNDVYTNREGQKVYSVQIMVQELEFCESKKSAEATAGKNDDFMNVPEGDDELPFA